MIKLTTDRAATVDTEAKWIEIETRPPPRGAKVLVANRFRGVATFDNWHPGTDWTHWFPLPTFRK